MIKRVYDLRENLLFFSVSYSNKEPANLIVHAAASASNSERGRLVKIKRIIVHDDFDTKTVDYDFSLIELVEPLKYDEKAQPMTLPDARGKVEDGEMCLVTGYGRSGAFVNRSLHGVKVPIVNQEKCLNANREVNPVTPRMVNKSHNLIFATILTHKLYLSYRFALGSMKASKEVRTFNLFIQSIFTFD